MNGDREKMTRLAGAVIFDEGYRAWREEVRAECLRRLPAPSPVGDDYPVFREALRRRCLEDLGGIRRRRQALRLAMAAGVIAAALLLVLLHPPGPAPSPRPPQDSAAAKYVVHTRPLTDRHKVKERRLALVRTRKHDFDIPRFAASVFRTEKTGTGLEEITDLELLAMFHPKPCAILRKGSESAQLYFLNAEDRKPFMNRTFKSP